MIKARILLDSISISGNRLTTFEWTAPKLILAEWNTHRAISRNASSSRAIPVQAYIEEARSDELRAEPVEWGTRTAGMVAGPELTGANFARAKTWWRDSALRAADEAEAGLKLGLHKDIINRILEPYVHAHVVASATNWLNFFGLRLAPDAKAEIRHLANAIWHAWRHSTPKPVAPGQWHLPYLTVEDETLPLEIRIKVSIARCARVSYHSFRTRKPSTVDEDVALYERLCVSRHWSPFEHAATPGTCCEYDCEWGNYTGWRQRRKQMPREDCAPLPTGYEV